MRRTGFTFGDIPSRFGLRISSQILEELKSTKNFIATLFEMQKLLQSRQNRAQFFTLE